MMCLSEVILKRKMDQLEEEEEAEQEMLQGLVNSPARVE